MYFNLIRRNSKKNYKENEIYFFSLIMSIIAFYVVLSIGKLDVMQFLQKFESDAVQKLFLLIKSVYVLSLFLMFCLIYVAQKFQLQRRNHEFGLMMMLGMKRSDLFRLLMLEDIYTSVLSLIIGLPVAILLSELISLVTAKLVGMGIIGHHFSLSISAILLTAAGFFCVKLLANFVLSMKILWRQPGELMRGMNAKVQKRIHPVKAGFELAVGVICLLAAYCLGIFGGLLHVTVFLGVVVLGVLGTVLVIKGFGFLFGTKAGRAHKKDSLGMFTVRQLQENVFHRSGALTISSLLILVAIVCMAYGVAVSVMQMKDNSHNMDYTVSSDDYETEQKLEDNIQQKSIDAVIDHWSEVRVSYLVTKEIAGDDTDRKAHTYDTSDILKKADFSEEEKTKMECTSVGNCLIPQKGQQMDTPHLISLSGWNALQKQKNNKELHLSGREVALYTDPSFQNEEDDALFRKLAASHAAFIIDGKKYPISDTICSDDIVVDSSITIGFGLIVSDEVFEELADPVNTSSYWNGFIKKEILEKEGLMQGIMKANKVLDAQGVVYESYLQNMGRQLFYIVAAGYLTIYLAAIFLLIANTVISLQYSMQERKTRSRYRTLLSLGSDYEALCYSSKRQIRWFFALPVVLAVISSIFGSIALLSGILPSGIREQITILLAIAGGVILFMGVVEWFYVTMVMRMSRRTIAGMLTMEREE